MKKFDQAPFSGEVIPPAQYFRARRLEAVKELVDVVCFFPMISDERALSDRVLEASVDEHRAFLRDVAASKMRRIN